MIEVAEHAGTFWYHLSEVQSFVSDNEGMIQ